MRRQISTSTARAPHQQYIRRLKPSTSTPRTIVQYGIPRSQEASRRIRRRGTILTQLLNLWPHGHGAQRTQKSRPQPFCIQRFLERALLLITVDLCARRVGRMKPRMEAPMWASRLAESRMTHQSLMRQVISESPQKTRKATLTFRLKIMCPWRQALTRLRSMQCRVEDHLRAHLHGAERTAFTTTSTSTTYTHR